MRIPDNVETRDLLEKPFVLPDYTYSKQITCDQCGAVIDGGPRLNLYSDSFLLFLSGPLLVIYMSTHHR